MLDGTQGGLATGLPNVPEQVDGIVVGAGHNGLVTAAYLAKAGLSVLVVEGRHEIGGGLTTADLTLPLFRHNPHGFFIRWKADHRIWRDLELARHGCRLIRPEVQNGLLFEGGERALVTYQTEEATRDGIARVSRSDAERFERLHPRMREIAAQVLEPLTFSPPLHPDEEREELSKRKLGRDYLGVVERSAAEVIADWFESEPMRALMLYHAAIQGHLPHLDAPGTGLSALRALAGMQEGRLVEGGSQELTDALLRCVYAHGGTVVAGDPVEEIIVEGDRATGVRTRAGRTFRAGRFVASSLPEPMTMERVGTRTSSGGAPPSRPFGRIEYAIYGVHLALSAVPAFRADSEDFPRALNVVLGYEEGEDVLAEMRAIRSGGLPDRAALHASIPSLNDSAQAPPGHHVSFAWQFVPPVADGDWSDAFDVQQVLDLMLDRYEQYAPGIRKHILALTVQTPSDTGRTLPSMPGGDHHQGSYDPTLTRERRSLAPERDQYRTSVEGLYLCGSSQHPRGGVTGGPGYNAAGTIAQDAGVDPWWSATDVRSVMESLE